MTRISQRMARSESVSAPISSATYRIGAASVSIRRAWAARGARSAFRSGEGSEILRSLHPLRGRGNHGPTYDQRFTPRVSGLNVSLTAARGINLPHRAARGPGPSDYSPRGRVSRLSADWPATLKTVGRMVNHTAASSRMIRRRSARGTKLSCSGWKSQKRPGFARGLSSSNECSG